MVSSSLSFHWKWAVLPLLVILLSGCMYRAEIDRQSNNPAAVREEIGRVQGAVNQYMNERSMPPIKKTDMSTPVYEKYVVDLNKLVKLQYVSSIPNNAFENGGNYLYVLVNPDTEPRVKLLDLVAFQTVADIERKAGQYAQENGGRLPLGAKLSGGWHAIDNKALGTKPVQIRSQYSNHYLPLLLHESGRAAIDYGLEIMEALQQSKAAEPAPNTDLRALLVDKSYFVPVRSYPYFWRDGQPVIASVEAADNN